MKAKLFLTFQQIGADLFSQRLAAATSGNYSVRSKEGLYITRSATQKAHLTAEDILLLPLEPDEQKDQGASVERVIHRAVYRQTDATALVHAHPRHAIALSYHLERFVPIDLEGQYYFPFVPIITPKTLSATEEAASAVAEALKTSIACIVRGHGAFIKATDPTPEKALLKAFSLMTCLEEACEVYFLEGLWRGR